MINSKKLQFTPDPAFAMPAVKHQKLQPRNLYDFRTVKSFVASPSNFYSQKVLLQSRNSFGYTIPEFLRKIEIFLSSEKNQQF